MEVTIRALLTGWVRDGAADMAASGRRGLLLAGVAAVSSLLGVAALGCAMAAVWLYALPYFGAAGAALTTAGCLLLLAAGVALAGAATCRRVRPKPAVAPSPEAMAAEAMRLVKENQGTALMAALVAGLLSGQETGKK